MLINDTRRILYSSALAFVKEQYGHLFFSHSFSFILFDHICLRLNEVVSYWGKKRERWAVTVTQLAGWLLPIPVIRGSIPVIGEVLQ